MLELVRNFPAVRRGTARWPPDSSCGLAARMSPRPAARQLTAPHCPKGRGAGGLQGPDQAALPPILACSRNASFRALDVQLLGDPLGGRGKGGLDANILSCQPAAPRVLNLGTGWRELQS